jgi:isoleucyl-tRNA synthetase
MSALICDEVNVKKIDLIDSPDDLIIKEAKANFKILGPKVGKLMGKIAPVIQLFSREHIDNFEHNGYERIVLDGQEIKLLPEDVEILTSSKEGYATYTDTTITVALDLEITEELKEEGVARELVNRIQNLRKESNFAVTDRIEVYIEGMSEKLSKMIINKDEYIKNETLAVNVLNKQVENLYIKEITIEEETLFLGIKKI